MQFCPGTLCPGIAQGSAIAREVPWGKRNGGESNEGGGEKLEHPFFPLSGSLSASTLDLETKLLAQQLVESNRAPAAEWRESLRRAGSRERKR